MELYRGLSRQLKPILFLRKGAADRFNHICQNIISKTSGISSENMAVKRVFVSRKLPQKALDLLSLSRHTLDIWNEPNTPIPRNELLHRVKNCNGILCLLTEKIDGELVDAAGSSLEVISTMSVGYDHVDTSKLKKKGIRLGNTPDVLTDATAELTIALLLMTSRRLYEAAEEARSGGWGAWSPMWMCGTSLKGKTIGIVGMGRIGKAVSKLLVPFQIRNVLYSGASEKNLGNIGVGCQFVTFDELLEKSDVICTCCALNESTSEIFNLEAFKKMKKEAIFINTSRGGIVNQEDLVTALSDGTIKAAGLDVTTPEPLPIDSKLFQLKNCVILPHIGSAELQTREDMAMLAVKNLLAVLDGSEMPAEVKL